MQDAPNYGEKDGVDAACFIRKQHSTAAAELSLRFANFDAIFSIRSAQWKDKQRLLTIRRIATAEKKMIETQGNELAELLVLCEVPEERDVRLPVIWSTRKADPLHDEISKTVLGYIQKGVVLQSFTKESDSEFCKWKDKLLNFLSCITTTGYAFEIASEVCVKFIDLFIPESSEAYRFLAQVRPMFADETGKLNIGTQLPALLEAVYLQMRSSASKSRNQMLSKKPYWDRRHDIMIKFIRKYKKYLQRRFDVQSIDAYLNDNPALMKAEVMNFCDAVPHIIRKEARIELGRDWRWNEFTNHFVEAESSLAYHNPNYKIKKDDEARYIDKTPDKPKYDNNKNHNRKNNYNKSSNHRNHNNNYEKNKHKNNYTKHNGDNNNYGNGGNCERNNAKSNNNNSKNNKPFIKGKGSKNGKQHSGKFQVNSVEEASMAEYVNKLVLTSLANAKYNMTLMMACIMLILVPLTSGHLPPSYEVEPCDQPMAPAFYNFARWDATKVKAAQFRVIPPACFPVGRYETYGILMHNMLIQEKPGHKISEIVFKKNRIKACDYSNLYVSTNGIWYDRAPEQGPSVTSTAQRFIEIAKAYNAKCKPKKTTGAKAPKMSENSKKSDDESSTISEASIGSQKAAKPLSAESFKLPVYGSNKKVNNLRSSGEEYEAEAKIQFNGLQRYAIGLEEAIAEIDSRVKKFRKILKEQLIAKDAELKKTQTNRRNDKNQQKQKLQKKNDRIRDEVSAHRSTQEQLTKCLEERNQFELDLLTEKSKTKTCLDEKKAIEEITNKRQTLLAQLTQEKDKVPPSVHNDELNKCLDEKNKMSEIHLQEKNDLRKKYNDDISELNNKLTSTIQEVKKYGSLRTNIFQNIKTITQEILNIHRIPKGTACIHKEAFINRLNNVENIIDTTQELEYINTNDLRKQIQPNKNNDQSIARLRTPQHVVNSPFGPGGSGIPLVQRDPKYSRIQEYPVFNITEFKNKTLLPTVDIKICDVEFKTLVDTGAAINMISKTVANALNLEIHDSKVAAVSASGHDIKINGYTNVDIIYRGEKYNVRFEICSIPLRYDIVLGYKTIKHIEIVNIFLNDKLLNNKNSIFTEDEIKIKPNSCTIFHVTLKNKNMNNTDVSVKIDKYWKETNMLLTMEQLCKIHDNKVPIVVVNAGKNPVQIAKNTYIGDVFAIEEIDKHTLRVHSEEIIPEDADWEESLPPYPHSSAPLTKEEFEIIITSSNMSKKGHKELIKILWRNRLAFHEFDGKSGLYNGLQRMKIDLKNTDDIPKKIKPARMSREKENEISKQITDMLANDMIEPSRSPYLSRVVLVRKKDQQWRFLVDFRYTNSLMKQQSHVIPRIDRITTKAAGKRFYTSFDLKAGFHQILLDDNSKQIAAFVTQEGMF
uniref:Reverse transcriptase domain-containing protein n=1 Tax=Strongyloides venezuelensis TaxID=75913 RepID=A0A0K0FAX1_STRVS